MSLPEILLWQVLRSRPGGVRFRRQFSIEPYTVDFACLSARVAIEVDGEQHGYGTAPADDARRDAHVRAAGFEVIRIAARDVLHDLDAVLRYVLHRCASRPLHHDAARRGPTPRSGEDL